MGMIIQGGTGAGFSAGVTRDNQLSVDGSLVVRSAFVSRKYSQAFNFNSIVNDVTEGDIIFSYENTASDKDFYVDLLRVSVGNNDGLFKIHSIRKSGTGNPIEAVNLNLRSSVVVESTTFGDGVIVGTVLDKLIANVRCPAGQSEIVPFDDILIVGPNNGIAVEYFNGDGGPAEILCRGYYESIQ